VILKYADYETVIENVPSTTTFFGKVHL